MERRSIAGRVVGSAMLWALLIGCDTAPPPSAPEGAVNVQATPAEATPMLGDWPEIRERGVIRFAERRFRGFTTLPRQGIPVERFRRLADAFAARHNLEAQWLIVDGFDQLLPLLEGGEVDVVVANVTITDDRSREVGFTLPLTHTYEWLIGRTLGTIGVPRETSYVESLAAHYPDADVRLLDAGLDPSEVVRAIDRGEIDATIMDAPAARTALAGRARLRKLAEVPGRRELAWAVRLSNPELKTVLDAFLLERHVFGAEATAVRTWQEILQSRLLRLGTLNDPTTYYLWRGELLGFEYELAKLFADAHGLDLEVVVAESIDELLADVAAGRVDYASASLTPTADREAAGVVFTAPYMTVNETFVTVRAPVEALDALRTRTVVVNASTSYASTLRSMRDAGFELIEDVRTPTSILDAVLAGEVDVTLLDSHRAELTAKFDERLSLGYRLHPGKVLAWAYAPGSDGLGTALDDFIGGAYRGYDYNVLRNKYFRNERRMARQRADRVTGRELSPFDDLVKAAVARAGGDDPLDWRLIVAQMYQESGFDPDQVSFAGARGLLQMMPRTAMEIGVDPDRLDEPEISIHAGVDYLHWTMDHFAEMPIGERIWFALASYNAGVGHVRDARLLAGELGFDDALWFDNVEIAMLKLAEPEYARQAMYGYVRGSEPFKYVREIRELYRAYLDHFRVLDAVPVEQDAGM